MDSHFMNNLSFQHVSLLSLHYGLFEIQFALDSYAYYMLVPKQQSSNPKHYPIYHEPVNAGNCPFCGRYNKTCPELERYSPELFIQLTEHPSIRLQWLFEN